MKLAVDRTYTTTDLRRPEVLDEALSHPVAVRDGRSGRLLFLAPVETLQGSADLLDRTRTLLAALVEHGRDRPSPAALGSLHFIAGWSADRRQRFLLGMIEALAASIADDDPAPVDAYVKYMSRADEPAAPATSPTFLDRFADQLGERLARGSTQ